MDNNKYDTKYNTTYTKVYSYKNMNMYILFIFLMMFGIYLIAIKYKLN
jgi:hypothetical protein